MIVPEPQWHFVSERDPSSKAAKAQWHGYVSQLGSAGADLSASQLLKEAEGIGNVAIHPPVTSTRTTSSLQGER
ncbi:hypothetical protein [Nocardioides jensenii]|uniref:hypothetical protein n=1 Tax=Nocardioides jensenii TaxID=1843 RepID=UPI0008367CB5|nr:hypothetical protein [Nocardioides jensenii]